MKRPRFTFRTKLLASYLLLVVAVELITALALNWSLGADLVRDLDQRLERQARGAAAWLATAAHPARLAPRMAALLHSQVQILDPSGKVVGDSEQATESAQKLDAAGLPEEVLAAQRNQVGRAIHFSAAQGEERYYVALRAVDGRVVRLSVPLSSIRSTLRGVRHRILFAAAIAFLAAIALGLLASRLAVIPLRAMMHSAARIAGGDYKIEKPSFARDEFDLLAQSLASMAAQLETRIDDLKRLETMRREFLADASHELRTPVAAIQGYVQTLLEGKGDETSKRECLDVIDRHAKRIGRLVDDLLQLADLEARVPDGTAKEPIPIEALAARVLRVAKDRAAAAEISLHLEMEPDLVVLGNPNHIEQILENLVDNALKYGRPAGHVRISGSRARGRVTVRVADDGPGIAAEHLPRIFDRFYRVDHSRSRVGGGTGLGLAIVKRLVESMDGALTVESTVERGTTFTVELPVPGGAATT